MILLTLTCRYHTFYYLKMPFQTNHSHSYLSPPNFALGKFTNTADSEKPDSEKSRKNNKLFYMKAILKDFQNKKTEQALAEKAHERLYFYLNRAKLTLDRLDTIKNNVTHSVADQKEIDRFETWFGSIKNYKTHIAHVKSVIDCIHKRFEDENIILVYDIDSEDKDTFAFVTVDDIYKQHLKIHLCQAFFDTDEDNELFNTKIGTILHELTHIIGDTEDFAYGEDDCKKMDKQLSIFNADSYEMYIESFRNMPSIK